MFDFLGYAETHTAITTALVCCLIVLLILGGYVVSKFWRYHLRRMKDIQVITEACTRMESALDKAISELGTRCDVPQCPGLAYLRDEFHVLERNITTSITEIKTGIQGTNEEVRRGVYELLEFVKSALFRGTNGKNGSK